MNYNLNSGTASRHGTQPNEKSSYQDIFNGTEIATQSVSSQSSLNYESVGQTCLETLLGELKMNMRVASNLSFELLGIDSLRAMTFVELLSDKLRIKLPMSVKSTY